MLGTLDISATGLSANRLRMTAISNNLANMHTTRARVGPDGKVQPYQRRTTIFRPKGTFGDKMAGVTAVTIKDTRPGKQVYMPGHPDADEKGYVHMPNVESLTEYVDAINAQRGYEANVQAMNITKNMINTSIRILS